MKILLLLFALVTPVAFSAGNSLQEQVVSHERQELDALKRGDYKAFANFIAENAVFLNSGGHGDKAQVVGNVSKFKLLDFTMSDVRFVPLSSKSGLIAYKLTQRISAGSGEFTSTVYASAIWAEQDGKWVTLFSQETPAKD